MRRCIGWLVFIGSLSGCRGCARQTPPPSPYAPESLVKTCVAGKWQPELTITSAVHGGMKSPFFYETTIRGELSGYVSQGGMTPTAAGGLEPSRAIVRLFVVPPQRLDRFLENVCDAGLLSIKTRSVQTFDAGSSQLTMELGKDSFAVGSGRNTQIAEGDGSKVTKVHEVLLDALVTEGKSKTSKATIVIDESFDESKIHFLTLYFGPVSLGSAAARIAVPVGRSGERWDFEAEPGTYAVRFEWGTSNKERAEATFQPKSGSVWRVGVASGKPTLTEDR